MEARWRRPCPSREVPPQFLWVSGLGPQGKTPRPCPAPRPTPALPRRACPYKVSTALRAPGRHHLSLLVATPPQERGTLPRPRPPCLPARKKSGAPPSPGVALGCRVRAPIGALDPDYARTGGGSPVPVCPTLSFCMGTLDLRRQRWGPQGEGNCRAGK